MKTNLKVRTIARITVALCSLLLNGCKKDDTAPTNTNNGPSTTEYNMYMTDAPSAIYQQVNVNVTGAQVSTDAGTWVSLNVHPGIYNLLTLTNGNNMLIASGLVTVGHISQVQLILGASDNTVMVNNVLYPLETPSGDQSGLKINVDNILTAGVTYNLTLDFDAGMSVIATGSGTYILKPVIRADVSPYSGSIKGSIAPSYSESVVMAISASMDTLATMSSTASGGFVVQGLATGSYTLVIIPVSPFSIKTFGTVNVSSGQATEVGTITLQ